VKSHKNSDFKTAINNCQSSAELISTLVDLNLSELSISNVHLISRQLQNHLPDNSIKIAYLSNFTLEPLPGYARVYAAHTGIFLSDFVGDYNQFFQSVLDRKSPLIQFDPEFLFISLSLKNLSPKIHYEYNSLSLEQKKECRAAVVSTIYEWAAHALNNTKASILLSNFPRPGYPHSGIADLKEDYGETEFYFDLNLELLRHFKKEPRLYLFDLDNLAGRCGKQMVNDPKMYYLAKMEWSGKFIPFVAEEIVSFIRAIKNLTKKCLVLDLDNTLWGGVLGEEGPMGIKISKDDPEGEAYYDFQRKILTIKNRGILLAVCSKNNPGDVAEVFERRTDMPLQKTDFAAIETNWDPKHQNLARIAQSLNIGTDSLVFLDDNPAECLLIKQMMPEVKTVQLPKDPAKLADLIDSLWDFEKATITKEDVAKSAQYQQNIQRQEQKQRFGDLRAYLESLETEIVIRPAQEKDLERVVQLFTKTNQFNVTTIRYNLGHIQKFVSKSGFDLSIVEARDQFGVLGTIGLYLLEKQKAKKQRLDSFILSCRAMGRGIESAIMNHIKNRHLKKNKKDTVLEALYIPTPKNKPVENFFEEQGFEVSEKNKTGEKRYTLSGENAGEVTCGWIKVLDKKEYDGSKN
jgi:FkbH-like protein